MVQRKPGHNGNALGTQPHRDGPGRQLDEQQVLQGTNVRWPQSSQHGHRPGKGPSQESGLGELLSSGSQRSHSKPTTF